MPTYTLGYTVQWKPAGSWVDITSAVLSVSGNNTLSTNSKNPLAFGDAGEVGFTVDVRRAALSLTTWAYVPIRVQFERSAVSSYNFWGVILGKPGNRSTVHLNCKGLAELIRKKTRSAYSVMFLDYPAFTRTTATSVEDPSDAAYQAGLGNYLAWQAGGRPLLQAATYTDADFYYDFDQAILPIHCAWAAGEDGWSELQKLAQACGGQIYQACGGPDSTRQDGILIYTQPLSIANGSPTYTFTADVYGDIEEQNDATDLIDKVVVPFKRRGLRPVQEVVNDSTPRQIPAGESRAITLEPKLPLASLQYAPGSTTQLASSCIQATFQDGTPVLQGAGGYTHTVAFAAQQITLTLTNGGAGPLTVNRIILQGEPAAAGEPGSATAGSGDNALTKTDNDYIQSESHAQRLADLGLAIYGVERPVRRLIDCPYDPDRFVGETVAVTNSELSLSAVAHLIVAKQDDETGAKATYDVISLTGLPYSDEYFIVSVSAQSTTKKLGF